jgi:Fe-S cluster assembly protein SufD
MTTTLTNPARKTGDPYLASFQQIEAEWGGQSPPWVQAIRKAGIAHFCELRFPTTQHEEWRFTNVAPIAQLPFKPALRLPRQGVSARSLEPFHLDHAPVQRLVFLDGHYSAELSSSLKQPHGGIKVGSLAAALTAESAAVERHLARYANPADNAFVALNAAFFQDGAFIVVPAGTVVAEPIHLLFIATTTESGAANHPRNLIIAQKNSRVAVFEQYVSLTDGAYVTNAVTELVVGEGATVEHGRIQNESREAFHLGTVQAQQEAHSRFVSHSISLGARLARNDIHSVLGGAESECLFNGLYVASGDQLVDHHTVIDHAKPHCASHEFYHGILDDRARGVFNGKIFVRKDAQKTDAKQTNRNVLLSDEATVDTKPQLEIFADDVKCTHGATVGRLDEEAVFYLCSRGIGADEARQMLLHAFGRHILERISVEAVRESLDELLLHRLT